MKVLIADDDPISRRHLERCLQKWHYDVISVANGCDAWEILQRSSAPPLAIVDWMMPGLHGLELCRRVRTRRKGPYVYLILVTSKHQRKDIIRGMEAGADDYLAKPFDRAELQVRLRAGHRILELEERLLRACHAFKQQATHDSLTGLWNRRAILERLRKELDAAQRRSDPLSIAIADVDHFKSINDSIGRYGGEEFLIILPGCDEDRAVDRIEQLRQRLISQPLTTCSGELAVTLSFGVAACIPQGVGDESHTLICKADDALYEAKRGGRNQVRSAGSFHETPVNTQGRHGASTTTR